MRRRTVAALALVLLLAGSAVAAKPATPPKSYPTGAFLVAGTIVKAGDVFDARALPDMRGKPSLMITLSPPAAARIVAAATGEARLRCTLDGKPLGDSAVEALAGDHILQLSGDFGGYEATEALARRISGRDPLPDAEADE